MKIFSGDEDVKKADLRTLELADRCEIVDLVMLVLEGVPESSRSAPLTPRKRFKNYSQMIYRVRSAFLEDVQWKRDRISGCFRNPISRVTVRVLPQLADLLHKW